MNVRHAIRSFLRLATRPSAASLALSLCTSGALAQIVHQTVPFGDREATPSVWFHTMSGVPGGASGCSGLMNLGSQVLGSPSLLYGASLTFTPEGTFVTYIGGTTSTVPIYDPSGAPLTDLRGAALLASTLDLGVDSGTGSIYTATLYSGVVLWSASHTYLLLLGGPPTTYEITAGGLPLTNVRGVSRLAAQLPNTGTVISPNYILFSGAAIYSDSKAWLTTTAGVIATSEITLGGASIPGIRGFTPMGGQATPALLDSAAFFYTAGHTYLMLTGPGISIYDVNTPSGAAIAGTWGIVRQSPSYVGGGFFQGAANVITSDKQWFVLVGGGIAVSEITQPGGAALTTNVQLPAANTLLRQASSVQEILASWASPWGPTKRGTVIGNVQ